MKKRELHHYQSQLLALRSRLRGDLERVVETLRSGERPVGEHDQTVSEAVDKERSLETNEENIQRQIGKALQRIEDGTYGVCLDCGEIIAIARLDAVPYVPYCTDCQHHREQAAVTS